MSFSDVKLKSPLKTGQSDKPIPQRVLYLYSSRSESSEDVAQVEKGHRHPDCWQIEYIAAGARRMKVPGRTYKVEGGDIMIIPPSVWHQFVWTGPGLKSWSIKFAIKGFDGYPELMKIKAKGPVAFFIRRIANVLSGNRLNRNSVVMEYLIADLMDYVFNEWGTSNAEPEIVTAVKHLIDANLSHQLNVDFVSRRLGYSKDHLVRSFKRHTGMTIKRHIDVELYTRSKRLIAYSNKNFSEIAAMLEFPDVFSFSRFFRRMYGDCPRVYRKNIMAKQ